MDIQHLLVIWTFLCPVSNFVRGLQIFSPPNIKNYADAQLVLCQVSKRTEPTPELLAICGLKGEACSIAVYQNQSEAHVQKDVKCDCLEQVFPDVDIAYHNIPGKSELFTSLLVIIGKQV